MPQARAMQNDLAKPGEEVRHTKVTKEVIECGIHLTAFQGNMLLTLDVEIK